MNVVQGRLVEKKYIGNGEESKKTVKNVFEKPTRELLKRKVHDESWSERFWDRRSFY